MEKDNQSEPSGAQRILSQKHVSWKDGCFFLWNLPGINFPMHVFIDIIYSLQKESGKSLNQTLYEVGERQTVIAVDYMKQRFGFKRDLDVINSVLQQSLVLGYGIFNIIQFDPKSGAAIIKNQNNPFAKHYRMTHGVTTEPIDFYFAGTMAGVIEAVTGHTLAAVETECIAKGDPHCLFEIRKPEEIDASYADRLPNPLIGPEKIRELVKKTKDMLSAPKQ
jgi:hypothetical protein